MTDWSEAGRKAWKTRRRREAARKAWATRRRNSNGKKVVGLVIRDAAGTLRQVQPGMKFGQWTVQEVIL